MKGLLYLPLLLAGSLYLTGCGGGGDDAAPPPPPPPPAVDNSSITTPTATTPTASAPPSGMAPATLAPDPLESVKVDPVTGTTKSDLEALQAVVDAYSIGVDGLGAPAIPNLDALVAKGFLRKVPNPPPGKKWAYDSAKWKVSLVDQ